MNTLEGKWSLVTGASRGVGLHVSEGLAQLGSNLVLHSRELSHTEALASKLRAKGVQVVTVSGELSDQSQVDQFLDEALAKAGHIDVVINLTSGIQDQPELSAYSVSKAAVDKFVCDLSGKLAGTGVQMNLLDPGWLRTDLGGPNAPNDPSSVLPGALVPALLNEGVSGRFFCAQDYADLTLAAALEKAMAE